MLKTVKEEKEKPEEPEDSDQDSFQDTVTDTPDSDTERVRNKGKQPAKSHTKSHSNLPSHGNQQYPNSPSNIRMSGITMGDNGGGKTSLPNSMKLKGEENYAVWKTAIVDLANINGCLDYIHPKIKPPKEIDIFKEDEKYEKEELDKWKEWRVGNACMKLIISTNCKEIPQTLITDCQTAKEMWSTLQTHYEGSGTVLKYQALETYTRIRYEDYNSLEQFIVAFKKAIEKLSKLKMVPPED
jgi:hypothetical protein